MVDKSAPLLKADKAWDGIMSLPYEVALISSEGVPILIQNPVEEVGSLFGGKAFEMKNEEIGKADIPSVESNAYYLEGIFDMKNASRVVIELRKGESEATRLIYNKSSSLLVLDTSRSGELAKDSGYTYTGKSFSARLKPDENGLIALRVYVDTVSVEVFGGNGEAVISAMIYPDEASNGISLSGDAQIVSLNIRTAK